MNERSSLMILKETLLEVVKTQKENLFKTDFGTPREKLKEIKLVSGLAIIISGIRRAGKSTLLRQLTNKMKNFHYINFEDLRIYGFKLEDFQRLEEVFLSFSKSNIFLFDEIQNVEGWEIYVRALLDKKKTIIITGSNASLLSKELGTKLTGRHLKYELFPFSYSEYLHNKNKKPSINSFINFFTLGGFPEYLRLKEKMILQELFNDIIARDITVRYNLRNSKLVKELALYLLSNIGKEFSYQNLRKIYELGSVNTVISLVGYYEDSYLFFTVPQFDYSYRKQLKNPKKIYAVDSGLIEANSVSFTQDKGRILENIVVLHLKRLGKEIYYFNKQKECDFITREIDKKFSAFQVCYELNDENKNREINGLIEATDYLQIKTGTILTLKQNDKININDKWILVLPVWKWCLQKNG